MARASRGERCEKEKSPFATTLMQLMNEQPITTQAQLAEITGKTRQTISQYVNGISEPGYDTLVKIADHFDVSLDYLLGRSDIKSPSIDTQSIISKTGLTEDNVLRLEAFQEENMEIQITMANDFLSFLLDSQLSMSYLFMETTISIPPIDGSPLSSDDFVEQAIIAGQQRRRGYVQLSGEDSFRFYCSKIADRFEQLLIEKYQAIAKWRKSYGID